MMSRKDYELAAGLVRSTVSISDEELISMVRAYDLLFLADGNPRFDIVRFHKACGL